MWNVGLPRIPLQSQLASSDPGPTNVTADMAWRRATIQEAGSEDEEEDEAQSMKWHEIWDGGGNGIRHISNRLFIPLPNTKKLIFW